MCFCAPRCPESDQAKLQNHGANPGAFCPEWYFVCLRVHVSVLRRGGTSRRSVACLLGSISGAGLGRDEGDLFELSCGDRGTLVDAAVFVLLGCREAVSPSMGSQCRLIGTMKVVNFLDGLGRTQMIYTTLKALFLAPG